MIGFGCCHYRLCGPEKVALHRSNLFHRDQRCAPGFLGKNQSQRQGIGGIGLKVLLPISMIGGLIGAILLLVTPGSALPQG